jgi:hypothetical protein
VADAPLSKVVDDLLGKMLEPLGLDRWTIKKEFGPGENTAACSAMPEYEVALIAVDPDKLDTGDELDEILAHELAHCHTWPIASVADDFAIALAEASPDHLRESLAKLYKETARKAEEITTTRVGRAYVTLMRRLWKAEADLAGARAEIKALRKASA